jgi:hypothetical protein
MDDGDIADVDRSAIGWGTPALKVIIVGVLASSLARFRGELLRAMAANGHDVLALEPEDDASVWAASRRWALPIRRFHSGAPA